MLAYYVEWHLREAWRELMFADTQHTRDPVAPTERSSSAQDKATTHLLVDGSPTHKAAAPADYLQATVKTVTPERARLPQA
jgi:hypothetical protein